MRKRFRAGVAAALTVVAAGAALAGAPAAAPITEPVADDKPRAIALDLVGEGLPSVAWPRPCGIELAPGFVRPGERLAVVDASGAERPARIVVVASDAAAQPRYVIVELDELPRECRRLELRPTRLAAPAPRLRASRDSLALSFASSADDGSIEWRGPSLVVASGATRVELALGKLGLSDDGDERAPSTVGPVRAFGPDGGGAELAIPLTWSTDDGGAPAPDSGSTPEAASSELRVDVRVSIAGSGRVATLDVVFVAPRELLLRRLVLRGRVHGGPATLRIGETVPPRDKRGGQQVTAPGLVGAIPPDELAAAIAPLRVIAGEGRARVEIAWSDYGLARPSAASLRAEGSFALDLVAEPLLVHAGQTLRRTLQLARGDRVLRELARPYAIVRAREPMHGAITEETRAWLAPWKEAIARWLARPRRLDDRGCYVEAWGELANGEYDLGGSLLRLGRLERDATWLACGEAIARHTLEWDRGTPEEAPAGLFFQHGDDHASGKVEAGHQWAGGALELARTTGSLAALDAARALASALGTWRERAPGKFAALERRIAWPLRIAAEVDASVGEPAARRLGELLLRDFAARQRDEGWLDGDRRNTRDGPRVWVNTWVSLGITVDALLRAERAFPGQGAADAAARLARFVAANAIEPDGIAEVLLVDPESGAVMEKRARCTDGELALVAAGLGWLARTSGDRTLESVAAGARERARATLAVPSDERFAELAKALLAIQLELDSNLPSSTGRQSLSSPSSVRRPPRPNR